MTCTLAVKIFYNVRNGKLIEMLIKKKDKYSKHKNNFKSMWPKSSNTNRVI